MKSSHKKVTRRTGRKRLLLGGGIFLLAGVLATSAAFTDWANLNMAGDTGGIGNPNKFDIGVVLADNTVEQADTDAGYDWPIAGSDALIPGGKISTDIPVFNNTKNMDALVDFQVQLLNSDGSVPDHPNITQFLTFDASVDGEELFVDKSWDDSQGELGVLSARDADALAQGDEYVEGAGDSHRTLTLTINYVDAPETVDYNGGQAAMRVHFDAQSVTPSTD